MAQLQEQHKKYERRLAIWLGITYALIAILTAALVIYAALKVGWPPGRR